MLLETSRGVRLRCVAPRSRRERMRGLRDREALALDEAMWFERASSVHTFGMRVEILVARLDRHGEVVDVRRLAPGRLLWPRSGVMAILECHRDADVRVGDRVVVARPTSSSDRRETR
jgi:uncharacterized membrane protein (UPF0127 family)